MVDADTEEYERGIPAEFCRSADHTNLFLCPVCDGVPHCAVQIPGCGHLYCDCCIVNQLDSVTRTAAAQRPPATPLYHCGMCRSPINFDGLIPQTEFHPLELSLLRRFEVTCPFKCKIGTRNVLQMQEHRMFYCPNRKIKCPNIDCPVQLPACNLQIHHFQTCSFYRLDSDAKPIYKANAEVHVARLEPFRKRVRAELEADAELDRISQDSDVVPPSPSPPPPPAHSHFNYVRVGRRLFPAWMVRNIPSSRRELRSGAVLTAATTPATTSATSLAYGSPQTGSSNQRKFSY